MTLTRRELIKTVCAAGGTLAFGSRFPRPAFAGAQINDFTSRRPAPGARRFTSTAVEAQIQEVKRYLADKELAWLFENCYPNTLDTTVQFSSSNGRPDTFVITGDIAAMWLRDSTAQVMPYLSLVAQDRKLQELLAGVVNRQTRCILIDPYANAFDFGARACPWGQNDTGIKPDLCERKWEIDSLCYPVRLAHAYWRQTRDASPFDADWRQASRLILQTFREQQRKHDAGPYTFQRKAANASDTLPLYGLGNPTRPVGLIHSAFRPSDDACIYPFLVPANFFAVQALKQLAEIHSVQFKDAAFAAECNALASEITVALRRYATVRHPRHGTIYAYEVDGFGNALMMDDANVPSLLSLPYIEAVPAGDPLYRATRRFILSQDNPYFFRGRAAEGIGGPHVGLRMIWPLGIIMRALTATDEREIIAALAMLKRTHAGTGFMHEAFDQDQPEKFTRPWFAWANTLFGELVVKLYRERPHILGA